MRSKSYGPRTAGGAFLADRVTIGAVAFLIWTCCLGLAQESPCTVPVNVAIPLFDPHPNREVQYQIALDERRFRAKLGTRPWDAIQLDFISMPEVFGVAGWSLARNIPPDGFIALEKSRPIPIMSVTVDRGPRRIVFVAENAQKMPDAARKIEAAVITHILSRARPEDSFALLTARGPRLELRFGSSPEAMRATAEGLANPPQVKAPGQGALDAVLEAVGWLQPPQSGDSVFVMTMGLEGKHRAKFSKVREAVATGRLRVFAMELGAGVPPEVANPGVVPEPGPYPQTLTLSRGSGGAAAWEVTTRKDYMLTDDRLKQLIESGGQMYNAMTEFYLLRLDSIGPHLTIGLAPRVRDQLKVAMVLHPWYAPECSDPPPTPAPVGPTK